MGKVLNEKEKKLFEMVYNIKAYIVILSKRGNNYYVSLDGSDFIKMDESIAKVFFINKKEG